MPPSGEKIYESVLADAIARYPTLVTGIGTITNDLESDAGDKTLAVAMGTLENQQTFLPSRAGILWNYASAVTRYGCDSSTDVGMALSFKVASLLEPSLLDEPDLNSLKSSTEQLLAADAAALAGYQKLMSASEQDILDIVAQRRSSASVCIRGLASYR